MNSNELKELVKEHFSLVETTETVETFGEIMDENKAFTILFPGDELKVGSEVKVRTEEGQELTAPDGEHRLEDGKVITVEAGVVTAIETASEVEEAEGAELKEMTPVEGEIDDKVEFDARTDAEEEGYKDGEADEKSDIVSEVAKAVIDAVKEEVTKLKKITINIINNEAERLQKKKPKENVDDVIVPILYMWGMQKTFPCEN
mgnify:CR=1 FL=1